MASPSPASNDLGRFWARSSSDDSDSEGSDASSASSEAGDDQAAAGAAAEYVPPESILSGRVTPPPQPKGSLQPKVTPEATRKAMGFVQQHLFTSPDKKGKAAVARGLRDLQTIHEEEEDDDEKFATKKARTLANQIVHSISPQHDPAKAEFHAEASQKLDEEGGLSATSMGFVKGLVDIGGSPQRVIPTRHLSQFDPEKGGFHVDLDDHSHAVEVIAENPRTRVRYARIDGKKISTMFPEGVDLDRIVAITISARVLAKRNNQSLRLTPDGYVIECYAKDEVSFSSIFPVFLYEVFAKDQTFELVPGITIDSQQALDAAKQLIKVVPYYSVNDDQGNLLTIIVDIAPIFKNETNIEKGVMFRFDRAIAPELFPQKRKR